MGGVRNSIPLTACLEIDDNGQAITQIAEEIKRIAHVPVQRWDSILSDNWWNNLFGGAWWKKIGFVIACSLLGSLFLPCMIPCFIRLIHSVVQGMQMSAIPLDPETATKGKTHSLMILKTNTFPVLSAAQKAVVQLESKTRIKRLIQNKGRDCKMYRNDSCQRPRNPCGHCVWKEIGREYCETQALNG